MPATVGLRTRHDAGTEVRSAHPVATGHAMVAGDVRALAVRRRRARLEQELAYAREDVRLAEERRQAATARRDALLAQLTEWNGALQQTTELAEAVEEARGVERRAGEAVDEARDALERVRAQRVEAERAFADADAEVRALETAPLTDEQLKAELDAVQRDFRAAQREHVAELRAFDGLQSRIAERAAVRAALEEERAGILPEVAAVHPDTTAVRAALDAYHHSAATAGPDPTAGELLARWREASSELACLTVNVERSSTADALAGTERAAGAAVRRVAELEAVAQRSSVTPEARAAIDAAHQAVLDAEERAAGVFGFTARARLRKARDEERRVLLRHGLTDAGEVLAGGTAEVVTRQLDVASRELRDAEAALSALQRAAAAHAVWEQKLEEVRRQAAHVLGVDPGDRLEQLLSSQVAVEPARTRALADALRQVGVFPVEETLTTAAHRWLAEQARHHARHEGARARLERLEQRLAKLDEDDARDTDVAERSAAALREASAALDESAKRLRALEEAEAARAETADSLPQRLEAAEELRARVVAVARTLDAAEHDRLAALAASERSLDDVVAQRRRAESALSDAVRAVVPLTDGLSGGRPAGSGDALSALLQARDAVAAELDSVALTLADTNGVVEQAMGRINDAERVLGSLEATGQVAVADIREGLAELVGQGGDPVVLVEPFSGLGKVSKEGLLDDLVQLAGRRPVVLLTDDPDVTGWASTIPAGAAARITVQPAAGDHRTSD